MTEKPLILLLQIINDNGNVKKLTREGLSFKKIAELTDEAIRLGYLEYKNDTITLTDTGNPFLMEGLKKIKKQNKEEWIDKDFKSKITKIDKNDIFLPSQDELSFLKR